MDHLHCVLAAAVAGVELQASQLCLLRHFPSDRPEVPDGLDRDDEHLGPVHHLRLHVHPLEVPQPCCPHAEPHFPEECDRVHRRRD